MEIAGSLASAWLIVPPCSFIFTVADDVIGYTVNTVPPLPAGLVISIAPLDWEAIVSILIPGFVDETVLTVSWAPPSISVPIPTLPPIITDWPIPTPPATVNAPEEVEVDAAVEPTLTAPLGVT